MISSNRGSPCPACGGAAASAASRLSRRRFLGSAAAGVATGLITASAVELGASRAARAASALTPDQALQALADGNQRFVEARMKAFDEDLSILKEHTAGKQEPFAAVLSCADSRVPVEIVFDQSIGHVFVTRVAGNVASSEVIASLEYGAAVLGTRAIMVLGHSSCGAVSASIDAKPVPGQISALYRYIRPAVDQAGSDVDAVGKANAKIQAAILRDASPVLAEFIKKNALKIVAGFYDLASGRVEVLR